MTNYASLEQFRTAPAPAPLADWEQFWGMHIRDVEVAGVKITLRFDAEVSGEVYGIHAVPAHGAPPLTEEVRSVALERIQEWLATPGARAPVRERRY